MRTLLLFILLSTLGSLSVWAQIDLAPRIPDSLVQEATELVREERVHMRLNSAVEGTYVYYEKVTILNNNSTANRIYIGYDQETPISQLRANLYDKNGLLIRKIKKEEFEDFAALDGFSVYQDNRYKRLVVSHTDFPYTIEWEYEQKMKGLIMAILPDWNIQDFGTAIERASLTVEAPPGIQLHYRSVNIALQPRVQTLKDAFVQYHWQVKDLRAIKEEPYAPHDQAILPEVQLSSSSFQVNDYKGSMDDWKVFGAFKADLYRGRDDLPMELKTELDQVLQGAKSNLEKIERLYRYMQNRMRYVSVQLGIGGWQPFTADYVYRNKYGDCKALTNFMKSMLSYANIKAYPANIQHTDEVPWSLDEQFVSDPQFNHVILYVPGENVWLECTSTDYPVNYLGEGNADRNVLLLTEQGGRPARTPALKASDNREVWKAAFRIGADGSVSNSSQVSFFGAKHELYRDLQKYLQPKERKEWLEKNLNLSLLTLDSLALQCRADRPQAELSFVAALSRVGSRSGKRWFLPFVPLVPLTKVPPKVEQRKQRVVQRHASTQEAELEFILPAGYKLESLPYTDKQLDSPFGQYRVQVQQEGNHIRVKRFFQTTSVDLPASEYGAFCNFYREVARLDGAKLVLISE